MADPEPEREPLPAEITELAELSRREGAWLRRLARRAVRDVNDAEDVLQETWLRVLRAAPPAEVAQKPWLARVLNNVVFNRWRGERRRLQREVLWQRGHAVTTANGEKRAGGGEALLRRELERALGSALARLSEAHRTVIVLRHLEGLEPTEIAELLRIPPATVRSRLKRGLDRLKLDRELRRGAGRRWLGSLLPAWVEKRWSRLGGSRPAAWLSGRLRWAGGAVVVGSLVLVVAIQQPARGGPAARDFDLLARSDPLIESRLVNVGPLSTAVSALPLRMPEAPEPTAQSVPPELSASRALREGDLVLRVIDEPSGLELNEVWVHAITESTRNAFHPGGSDRPPLILTGSSPLLLSAEELAVACEMPAERRTLLVGAPGRAWSKVTIPVAGGGRRQVALEREARLSIAVRGEIAERGMELVVIRLPERFAIVRYDLKPADAGRPLRLEGLPPTGTHRVLVLAASATPTDILAEAHVELEADRLSETSLAVDAATVPPWVEVRGSVTTLAGQAADLRVRLVPRRGGTSRLAARERYATLGEASRVGSLERRDWILESAPVGKYVAFVEPLGFMQPFELRSGESNVLDLVLPELAEVEVCVRDAVSATLQRPTYVDWQARNDAVGKRTTARCVAAEASGATYRFHVVPGAIRLRSSPVQSALGEPALAGQLNFEAKPGFQRVELVVERHSSLRIRMSDAGFEVPYLWPHQVQLEGSTKAAWTGMRGLGKHALVLFDTPGEYRLQIEAPMGYEPIAPIQLTLHEGSNEIVVPLQPR